MRAASGWSDACILNVSSRGLMINAPAACGAQGSTIELSHGEHVIVATIVWRKGSRAGLQADSRVPVDDLLAMSRSPSLQLTASQWPQVDRRKKPRSHEDNRFCGHAMEFASIAMIAVSLAAAALAMVDQAFARPVALVQSALAR
jgi:hypothetical protein